MKKTSLVIMAAGIGSRFGGGIKQLEPVGPSGEIIMDYSIYDALNAGFDKVVFIIRKDLEEDFKEIIGKRIEKIAHVEYAYQELDDLPKGFTKPADRTKPWGTGQALLCAKPVIHEPFVVINADDYYGKEGFIKIHEYLVNEMVPNSMPFDICMGGFVLGNTLSENGGVTRGVCQVDDRGILKGVTETYEIRRCEDRAEGRSEEGTPVNIPLSQNVSMNMWGLSPAFLEELERGFPGFLTGLKEGDVKTEYLLPKIIDKLVGLQKAQVTVLETRDRWFGVTYKEDKPAVAAAIRNLVLEGVYPERLFDVK
ncbi:nucleotidyltransferase family protein [Lacrimispora celerecrescens]|uniref:Nucleotidyltransferase n=1 Tax=Lacrimispora celerecrescens TaxID=29354 RepID=A0A084JFR2_9FIRM|nr:sugar phosphate nucleotidyltransferase [Lacrimispora celerecrescens]KEZ87796.1 nucleotidyltransferase [Lacrimispora celerecrescens]